ncbi:MAG: M28 family peptidase [Atopobiaceae bacterium]|nr:M28 family peptidase [Atopobiaceae bacterium]
MSIKRSQEEARLILSRREALLTASMGAMTVALGACAGQPADDGGETPAPAPEPAPVAPAVAIDDIIAKIDRDYAYNLIKDLSLIGNDGCELGFRNAGSTGEKKCRERIVEEMKKLGLQVEVDTYPVHAWEFKSATLEAGGETFTLSSFAGAIGTDGPLTAEIVDCGDGTLGCYDGLDVDGKIALVHFDNYNYWFMAPAYEAELKGAKALIVETIGENYNVGTDTLYCFDSAARDAIPVLCITKDDSAKLVSMLEAGTVEGTLNVDVTIDRENGESANVLGILPGRDGTDQNITMGAHYDGYFYAFMDDVFGVGTNLAIVKALIDAGYQPEHNIIVIAFGSEEYGITSNHYDWCTGVWSQINLCRPEWVGKTICHLEMDSVRPDANTYIVNSTPEYHTWFKEKLANVEAPAEQYVNGTLLKGQNGPWGQDYDMEIAGVPGLCAGKTGDSVWKTLCYHTNASSPENDWNETVFNWISEQYARMLIDFDGCTIAPLDFSTIADQVDTGFDPSLAPEGTDVAAYQDAVAKMRELSSALYGTITETNAAVMQARAAGTDISSVWDTLLADNKALLDAYKIIQRDKLKLDIWDVVSYKFDVFQLNISSLNDAIAALESGDGAAAIDSLFNVDNTYLAASFSKVVYEYTGIEAMDPNRDDLMWGTGKVPEQVNTYDVFHAIEDKLEAGEADYADEIAMLQGLLATENDLFAEAIKADTEYVNQVNEILANSTLAEDLESLKALLA